MDGFTIILLALAVAILVLLGYGIVTIRQVVDGAMRESRAPRRKTAQH